MNEDPIAGKQSSSTAGPRHKAPACKTSAAFLPEVKRASPAQKEVVAEPVRADSIIPKLSLDKGNRRMVSFADEVEIEERWDKDGKTRRVRRKRSWWANHVEPSTAAALAIAATSIALIIFMALRSLGKI